jgi:ribosomal protein S18 acetylase RimI-like enzyme
MAADIRRSWYDDDAALLALAAGLRDHLQKIAAFEIARRDLDSPEDHVRGLRNAVGEQDGVILMAFRDGAPCGFAAGIVTIEDDLDSEMCLGRTGKVLEVFVAEDARRNHVGRDLMAELEGYFFGRGCEAIFIDVPSFDTGAGFFCRALGYEDWSLGYGKLL